ncbi:MAG: hypothetical protein Q9N34_08265 [Aquificota bacterium]|nr:hypothetical protein [Aquificota bacterium]
MGRVIIWKRAEAEIELANNTHIDGFLLLGRVEDIKLPNNTHLKGAVVIQSLEDELKLSNNSSIKGLLLCPQ